MKAKIILLISGILWLCLNSYLDQGQFMKRQMHLKTRKEEVATKQEELLVFRDQLVAFDLCYGELVKEKCGILN